MRKNCKSVARRLAEWAPVFEKFEMSGLSQRVFCRREQLNFATFSKWWVLRNQVVQAQAIQQSDFVPIQVPVPSGRVTELVVELPMGVTLRFHDAS